MIDFSCPGELSVGNEHDREAVVRELLFMRARVKPSKNVVRFINTLIPSIRNSQDLIGGITAEYPGLQRAFAEYFEFHCCLSADIRKAARLAGQEAWAETALARKQRVTVARKTGKVMRTVQSEFSDVNTLIDLGCGDGQATVSFLRAIHPFCRIQEVLLVDQSEEAIKDACRTLRESFADDIVIHTLQCDIRAPRIWKKVSGRQVVVLASGCLHELPSVSKLTVLRRVRRFARVFVLVELLSDHETPRSGSSLLVQQAASFYESLVSDAYRSITDIAKQDQVIGGFLLAELLDIWTMPYASRGNYHMSFDEWKKLFCRAGLDQLGQERIQMTRDGLEGACILAVGC